MSSSDENECPLCMEPLEVDDYNFYPCTCHYQICRFCWHRIRTDENGLCPACRKPYSENPVTFKPLSAEEIQKIKMQKKKRETQRKRCTSDNRKHLANLRVVQKNLVFAVGLSPRLADPDVLKKADYFGKFGKIVKVVMNHSSTYAGGSQGPSASAYITFAKAEDALKAIHSVNNVQVDGRTIKTSLGTTKYCSMFLKHLPCSKTDCMYLHEVGDEAASFTKEDMNAGKHTEYEKKLYEQMMNQINIQSNTGSKNGTGAAASVSGAAGAIAEPYPIAESSSSSSLLGRPALGTSPIDIPVLPARKSKKRGKEKRSAEAAAAAQAAKSPKTKTLAAVVAASSSTSSISTLTSLGSATTTMVDPGRGTSERRSASSETSSSAGVERGAEESEPEQPDASPSPPVAGAASSDGASCVADGGGAGEVSAEAVAPLASGFILKRESSPVGSPGRLSDILGDDGNGSSGYASGSSASSSLKNSAAAPYCATSVIPNEPCLSTDSPRPERQQQQQTVLQHDLHQHHHTQQVEDSFHQSVGISLPEHQDADPVPRFEPDCYDHSADAAEVVSAMRGDFDDLGFDPFAETQKAFAEILDNEAAASEVSTSLREVQNPSTIPPGVVSSCESERLSVPPGFSVEHSTVDVAHLEEQPFSSFSSTSSGASGGSKFLPFLLRNHQPQPQPQPASVTSSFAHVTSSLPDSVNGKSVFEKLVAGLSDSQIRRNHSLQSQLRRFPVQEQQPLAAPLTLQQQQEQEQRRLLQEQQQQEQEQHRLLQEQRPTPEAPQRDRQPVLSFLRSRGLAAQAGGGVCAVSKSPPSSPAADSESSTWNFVTSAAKAVAGPSPREEILATWNEWEDSLKALFPISSAVAASLAAGGGGGQARPPPPGLGGSVPVSAAPSLGTSSFVSGTSYSRNPSGSLFEDLFGTQTRPSSTSVPLSSVPPSSAPPPLSGFSGDWLEMDPAIVSTTRHAPASSLPIPSSSSSRADAGDPSSNSPPSWLLRSLEQLTNDSPAAPPVHQFIQYRRNLLAGGGGGGGGNGNMPPGLVPGRPLNTPSSSFLGSWTQQAAPPPPPPGLGGGFGAPPGFSSSIPHSFQSPFAPVGGGGGGVGVGLGNAAAGNQRAGLPHDIFSDSRHRSAMES